MRSPRRMSSEKSCARSILRLEFEPARAHLHAPLAVLAAERLQRADATLVAGCASLDAAAEPRLLLFKLLAHALVEDGLVVEDLLLAAEEGIVVAVPSDEAAAV